MNLTEVKGLIEQLSSIKTHTSKLDLALQVFMDSHANTEKYSLLLAEIKGKEVRTNDSYNFPKYTKYLKFMYLLSGETIQYRKGSSWWYSYPSLSDNIDFYPDPSEGTGAKLGVVDGQLVVEYPAQVLYAYEEYSRPKVFCFYCPDLLDDSVSEAFLQQKFEEWVNRNFKEQLETIKEVVAERKAKEKKAKEEKAAKGAEKERAEYLRLKKKFEGEK